MTVQDSPTGTTEKSASTALYCYGVASSAKGTVRAEGIGGAAVTAVRFGDLAALTSPVESTHIRARRRDLLRHLDVLTDALGGGTVLPLRFGAVFSDEGDLVARLLEPRHDELKELLRAYDGLVELSVKAFFEEEAVLREIVQESPRVARLREATSQGPEAATRGARVELGELVAAELQGRAGRSADGILKRLQPLSRAVDVDPEPLENQVLRAAFLVERGQMKAFDAAMDDLARSEAGRIRFKYLGPLPPHSFVSLEAQ